MIHSTKAPCVDDASGPVVCRDRGDGPPLRQVRRRCQLWAVCRDTPILFLEPHKQESARDDAHFAAHLLCFDLLQIDVFSNSPLPVSFSLKL